METTDGIFNLAGTGALVAAAMIVGRLGYRTLVDRMKELRDDRDFWRDRALSEDDAVDQ